MHEKKICFLIPTLNAGGTETYLLRFLQYSQGKIEAVVICRNETKGVLAEGYAATGARLIYQKIGYFNLLNWFRLYRLFRSGQFQSVCDLTGNFGGIPLWVANFAGIPKRIAFYRLASNHFQETFFRLCYNRIVNYLVQKYATHILANSQTGLKFFFGKTLEEDKRFRVIYNGLNVCSFNGDINVDGIKKELGLPKNAYVVGHVGRLTPAKNHTTLLQVASALYSKSPDIYFVVCGQDTEKLQSEVNLLGIQDRVKLLGYRTDVNRILKSFDIFYFPSITEGQPNALIEAMISGVPFVSSDIAAISETVPNFLKSQLFEPKDVHSHVNQILKFKNSIISIDTQACRTWAIQKYDHDIQFGKFLDIL